MFILLSPDIVKNDTSQQEQEQRSRVRDLSMEEERLVKSINNLRKEEEDEKQRVYAEMAKNKTTLSTQVSMLSREVSELESRKVEALKPAREIEAKASKVLADNIAKGELLEKRMGIVDDMKEQVLGELEKIDDKKQLLAEADEALLLRERGIIAAEAEVKRSANEVTDRWLQYHDAVLTLNKREEGLVARETAVNAGKEANVTFKLTLDAKEKDLAERERALNDKYQTFISAQEELGKI